jgi:hypothetical protein
MQLFVRIRNELNEKIDFHLRWIRVLSNWTFDVNQDRQVFVDLIEANVKIDPSYWTYLNSPGDESSVGQLNSLDKNQSSMVCHSREKIFND